MRIIKPLDPEVWADVASKCPSATFFHTPLWSQLIRTSFDSFVDRSIGALTADGRTLVLPLMETSHLLGGRLRIADLSSTFPGCYGGVISDGRLNESEVRVLYDAASRMGIVNLRICTSPLEATTALSSPPGRLHVEQDFTHLLPLERPYDELLAGFTSSNRRNCEKGRRMGVTVSVASTLEQYRLYYKLYERTIDRWGGELEIRHPLRLFENGFQLAKQYPEHIRLWLAEVDGEPVAGAWIFYWNRHVDYWHGASDADFFDHRPNNVLFQHIIRHANERGFKYFDFNPSGGHEGVARFKASFGAEAVGITRWQYSSPTFAILRSVRNLISRITPSNDR